LGRQGRGLGNGYLTAPIPHQALEAVLVGKEKSQLGRQVGVPAQQPVAIGVRAAVHGLD
jgi:hypothetical protein